MKAVRYNTVHQPVSDDLMRGIQQLLEKGISFAVIGSQAKAFQQPDGQDEAEVEITKVLDRWA